MGRSHPPSLLRLTERLVRDANLFGAGDVVLCACSGGPDSTALLHTLALLRPRIGHTVVAHGVDHGLRLEAPEELALVRSVAKDLDVPFATTRVSVDKGSNLQARARLARLEALVHAAGAASASVIATGHTADDRAETVLMRMLRGSGPRGLSVLPPRAPAPMAKKSGDASGLVALPDLIRPLLEARRRDVMAHLLRHGLPYATDPSNRDPRYLRVRVRHEVVPLLEQLSPRIVEHLSALADMLAEVPDEGGLDGLGRAQRRELTRARRLGRRSVRLRLAGGHDVEVAFPDGRVVLTERGRGR